VRATLHLARVGWLALGVACACACSNGGGGSSAPTVDGPVLFLTTDNLDGDDDDPVAALDAAGAIQVVWFSDRDGTKDLYAVHALEYHLDTGVIVWSAPIHITDNDPAQFPPPTQGDNFPSLLIDGNGTHHLAWHRVNSINASHILYAKSDGTPAGWAGATVVNITSGLQFDRFPHVVEFAADDLRVYFGSSTQTTAGKNDILVARSSTGGDSWGAAEAVPSLGTPGEQSSFPVILKPASGPYVGALQRWKLEPSNDALDPSADICYAESQDGETGRSSR